MYIAGQIMNIFPEQFHDFFYRTVVHTNVTRFIIHTMPIYFLRKTFFMKIIVVDVSFVVFR